MLNKRVVIYLLFLMVISGWKLMPYSSHYHSSVEEKSSSFIKKDTFSLLKNDLQNSFTFYTGTDFSVYIQADSVINQFEKDLKDGSFIIESQLQEWIDRLKSDYALKGKISIHKADMEKYRNVFSMKWLHEHLNYFLENNLVFVERRSNGEVIGKAILSAYARGSKQTLSFVTTDGREIINSVKYRVCF